MKRLRRFLETFKKPIIIIMAMTMLLTATAAVTPPKAEAMGLAPVACYLAEAANWGSHTLNWLCGTMSDIEDWAPDPD